MEAFLESGTFNYKWKISLVSKEKGAEPDTEDTQC